VARDVTGWLSRREDPAASVKKAISTH